MAAELELPRVVMMILVVILIVVGTIGNLSIILVISLTKDLWTTTNTFIINLAVADLFVTIIVDPYNAVGIHRDQYLLDHPVQCEVVGSICVITCSVSLATVATISFNRFLFVCYNPLHDRIFTKKRCGVMVLCLWLYGGVVDLPLHFGWGRHGYDLKTMGCTYDRTHTYGYTLYLIVMIVILPLLTVAYSYTNVYMFVRHSRKRLAGALNEAKVKQDDLKLIKTLVIMCVSFFICWSPYAIVVLADFKDNWPQTVHILALIMAHASSSINCVIYGFTNDKFRRGLFHLVRKVRVQADSENAQAANQPSHPPTAIEMFNINKPIAPDMIVVS
ncbi:melatonin receptor type 1A-like [Branchiostoma floridae x Branchiostoma belcheri]